MDDKTINNYSMTSSGADVEEQPASWQNLDYNDKSDVISSFIVYINVSIMLFFNTRKDIQCEWDNKMNQADYIVPYGIDVYCPSHHSYAAQFIWYSVHKLLFLGEIFVDYP